ncbi:MAG TPA: GAF domain-containing protein [Phycisphaerae bacterium]|nr:GAF domain-containing protein [Phycisphaerae bacterium]
MRNATPGTELLDEIEQLLRTRQGDDALRAVCELLHGGVGHYDWVGLYRADEGSRTLTLGPFAGEPTEHAEIPFGRGICGQAAERRETFLVQDVSKEGNYLSCSPRVRSEIVVPVFREGRVVGEIDIDSHALAPFTDADRAFLERVAELVAPLL